MHYTITTNHIYLESTKCVGKFCTLFNFDQFINVPKHIDPDRENELYDIKLRILDTSISYL